MLMADRNQRCNINSMPLWNPSAQNKHLAVLTSAGLFDTSRMATVTINGPGSFELLQ